MSSNENLLICERHDLEVPLLFTMKFPGAEHWCPYCGLKIGAFEPGGREVPATPELEALLLDWKAKAKPYLTGCTETWIYEAEKALAFLDIETGGFSITKNGVCEIAITVTKSDLVPIATFHKLIKPYPREEGSDELVSYKEDAMAVNGLTEELLIAEGEHVREVIELMWVFLLQHKVTILIAHNGKAFDLPRLEYLLTRFAGRSLASFEAVDTLKMAREKLSLPGNKLEHLCEHFGITNDRAHRAQSDTSSLLEVYRNLIEL